MWQEISAYSFEALASNNDTIERLNCALKAANGDGEAALAHLFLRDLVREANDLEIKIRRFAITINPAVKAEAERSQS